MCRLRETTVWQALLCAVRQLVLLLLLLSLLRPCLRRLLALNRSTREWLIDHQCRRIRVARGKLTGLSSADQAVCDSPVSTADTIRSSLLSMKGLQITLFCAMVS